MFDIGMPELIVIIIVALLVFGPKRLPELARAAGKGLAELKKSLHDVKQQVETEVKAIEGEEEGSVGKGLVDLKKSFEDVKRVVQTGFKDALDTSVAQKPVISAYEEIGEEEGDDLFGEEEEKEKKDEQNMKSLYSLLNSHVMSRLIYAVAKTGIPDLLKDNQLDYKELAERANVYPRSLYRVMRTLSSVNVFSEMEDGVFRLSDIGQLLRTDIPESQHALAVLMWEPWWRQGWDDLFYSLQTGKVAFDHIHGRGLFEYLKQNPEAAELFNKAMTSFTVQETKAILDAYDFSGFKKVVDIGGGQGKLLASLLKKYPSMNGVLLDLPMALDSAKRLIDQEDLSERCELVSGDFFKSFSLSGDVYILKSVIHDWSDEHAISILKNCWGSINKESRLLIIERIIPPGNKPSPAKIMDIVALVNLGGQERTLSEYEGLLKSSSFKLNRVINTNSAMSIIEGIPI